MSDISFEKLKEHSPSWAMYDSGIDGCNGCDWRPIYIVNWVDDWEQYLIHLGDTPSKPEPERIYVWTEEYGARKWYDDRYPRSFFDPVLVEKTLTEGLTRLFGADDHSSTIIYFFATESEMQL